jgi:hypothetical protein
MWLALLQIFLVFHFWYMFDIFLWSSGEQPSVDLYPSQQTDRLIRGTQKLTANTPITRTTIS